jgi:hypothetical protein
MVVERHSTTRQAPTVVTVERQEILIAFGLGGQGALGNVWRITAKGTDFYLDPLGAADAVHL